MNYYNFRRGGQGVNPSFKSSDWKEVTKITGKLVGVYYNIPKEITTKEGKQVTIPANLSVKLENDTLQISIEAGNQFRATINSLLSAEIWDNIELSTYISGWKYKVISVSNPEIKKTIISKSTWKEVEVNQSYPWFYSTDQIPELEITRNKKGEIVDIDDNDANQFLIEALREKFWKKEVVSEEINLDDVF